MNKHITRHIFLFVTIGLITASNVLNGAQHGFQFFWNAAEKLAEGAADLTKEAAQAFGGLDEELEKKEKEKFDTKYNLLTERINVLERKRINNDPSFDVSERNELWRLKDERTTLENRYKRDKGLRSIGRQGIKEAEYKREAQRKEREAERLAEIAADGEVRKAAVYVSWRTVAVAGGIATAYFGVKFSFEQLKGMLDKPTLAIKTSIPSFAQRVEEFFLGRSKTTKKTLTDIVFEPGLEAFIQSLTQSLLNNIKNGAPFRNVLFYGPPGTGKTAVAILIAEIIDQKAHNGMHYVYFNASNLDQYGVAEAIKQINELFRYAAHSHKKIMIIIDECEVLFANRSKDISEQTRKMLTAFLAYTGQPSRDFVIIGLTNRPQDFDAASLSRFDEKIYVGAPARAERERILAKYIEDYLKKNKNMKPTPLTFLQRLMGKKPTITRKIKIEDDALDELMLNWLLEKIAGFVGRDIEKLVIALQSEAYTTADCTLSAQMVRQITERKVSQLVNETVGFADLLKPPVVAAAA